MQDVVLWHIVSGALSVTPAVPAETTGFQITFGVKSHSDGKSWSGGIRDAGDEILVPRSPAGRGWSAPQTGIRARANTFDSYYYVRVLQS